jgi:hypothetical protein
MATHFDCLGLEVHNARDLTRLVSAILPQSQSLGVVGGIDVRRWQDAAGCRLVLGMRGDAVEDMFLSFSGPAGAHLRNVRVMDGKVATGYVVDDEGEVETAVAIELEEFRFLESIGSVDAGDATVVALGVETSVHANEQEFRESDASLMSGRHEGEEVPDVYRENGLIWPPRVGTESFWCWSALGAKDATGRLHGTVLAAERRKVEQTGGSFVVVTVRTIGFTATVCVASKDLETLPVPGSILASSFFLVGSFPSAMYEFARQTKELTTVGHDTRLWCAPRDSNPKPVD